MVRQLIISNMIKGDDAKASAKASEIFAAHAEDISKLPAAIRLQILINQIKHHENKELTDLYLNTYAQATDGNFKRQLSTALAYTTDADTVEKIFDRVEEQGCCETTGLGNELVFHLLTP